MADIIKPHYYPHYDPFNHNYNYLWNHWNDIVIYGCNIYVITILFEVIELQGNCECFFLVFFYVLYPINLAILHFLSVSNDIKCSLHLVQIIIKPAVKNLQNVIHNSLTRDNIGLKQSYSAESPYFEPLLCLDRETSPQLTRFFYCWCMKQILPTLTLYETSNY